MHPIISQCHTSDKTPVNIKIDAYIDRIRFVIYNQCNLKNYLRNFSSFDTKGINMYTTRALQDEILRLKKENDICILAHAYQSQDIWEVADYVGDSFGLSQKAAAANQKTMLLCGVRFMAETVKILSPQKKVLLSHPQAGCPMAQQISVSQLTELKKSYPDYAVAIYINSTSELKALSDVCVTSASAVKLIRGLDNPNILFIPDCNLGAWVAEQVPEKNIRLVNGGCPAHSAILGAQVEQQRKLHPDAKLLVHPECLPEVTKQADYVGSTTGIMDYAKKSADKAFLIGTENSIVQHLQFACPDKRFYALSNECICTDMKLTTLMDVYHCVRGTGGEEVVVSEDVMMGARRCIEVMLGNG